MNVMWTQSWHQLVSAFKVDAVQLFALVQIIILLVESNFIFLRFKVNSSCEGYASYNLHKKKNSNKNEKKKNVEVNIFLVIRVRLFFLFPKGFIIIITKRYLKSFTTLRTNQSDTPVWSLL